jgi:tetratricopeptide (TPR) repeat protein
MNADESHLLGSLFRGEKCVTISSVRAKSTLTIMALWAAMLCAFPLRAQSIANCHGDPLLESQIAQKPSADAFNALGVYFTNHKSTSCGKLAFQKALEIDPQYWQASLSLGLSYLSDGKNELATRQLQTAETEKPDSVEVHNALGTALEAAGKMSEAQAQFEAALALDPGSAFALFHRGLTLEAQGRLTAAIASYQQALELSPGNVDYACALANAYVKSGNINSALATLQPLTNAHADSSLLWYNLGVVYSRREESKAAIDAFQQALQLDPRNDGTRQLLARSLVDASRFQDAEPLANDLVERAPNDSEYLYLRASIYRGEGRFQPAIVDLKKAALHKPDDFDVEYNLGFCLAHAAQAQEAEVHLAKALAIHPESAAAKFQLMNVRRSLGKTDLAQKLADELQSEKSATVKHDLGNTFGAKANELMVAGKYQEAIKQYRLALGEDPRNAETLYNLSLAQRQTGDLAGEKSSLLRALELDPRLALAHDAMGVIYQHERHKSEARQEFERGIELDAQCASCKVHLATILLKSGDSTLGKELLRQAVEDDPESEEAHRNYGMALAASGALADGRAHLMKAVSLNPKSAETLSDLGMIQGKLSDPEAVNTLERVVNLQPDSAESHLNLGIALADRNRPSDALTQFNEAVRLAPRDASAHYNKGRVLTDLKHFQEARLELEEACRLQPDLSHARFCLALAQMECGDPAAALASLKDVAAARAMDEDAWLLQGRALENLGRMPEAIEAWKDAVKLQPDSREALYKLFLALKQSDPKQSAYYLGQFQSATEADHRRQQADSLGAIGSKFARSGEWQLAVSNFDEALRVCGDCNLAWQLRKDLGLSLCNAGDLARGEKELRIANDQKPNDPEIEYALRLIDRSRLK